MSEKEGNEYTEKVCAFAEAVACLLIPLSFLILLGSPFDGPLMVLCGKKFPFSCLFLSS
jgi:hypothetical protein